VGTVNAELDRQQRLLQALWGRDDAGLSAPGLQAYRTNAGAAAERALAAACPTVQQLVGDEAFAAIARALWRQAPPLQGDLARWGDALPDFLARDEALRGEPYLADVARVDLAVRAAEIAADASLDPARLARLGEHEPEHLWLTLAPGAALIGSAHPVASIWLAHRSGAEDRFAPVRAALQAGQGEAAFVWRRGWHGDVAALSQAEACFTAALLHGSGLGAALDAAPDLDFEAWLTRALREQWLADMCTPAERNPAP
jgi:hypothetical protein